MLDDVKQIFICNDTITGIFSAIYDAWKTGHDIDHIGIAIIDNYEQTLFCTYEKVIETSQKAVAVENLIKKNLGMDAYMDIFYATVSVDKSKGNAILGAMLEAKQIPNSKKIMDHLSNAYVRKVFELSRNVAHEAHLFTGFVRFRELSNKVLFSEITPKNQILVCIADHFADRLPLENWMIYDKTNKVFLVHQAGKKWVLVIGEEPDLNMITEISDSEQHFAQLWNGFCKSISIEERYSIHRQKSHLPLRYQQDMVEFQIK
ncbi:MAG: TIGR03915 family putative DNA repair protein [Lachnospiraceae bacterium]|nr:TIGR03915 family putative DNA repair protein [Lachnospiraceae bacterium]